MSTFCMNDGPGRLSTVRALLACLLAFLSFGAAFAARGDVVVASINDKPPLVLTNVTLQIWGDAELSEEIPPAGMLFLREDGEVYVGDGVTKGGIPVCKGAGMPDWHVFHKELQVNGNEIKLNSTLSEQASGTKLTWTADGERVFWILSADDCSSMWERVTAAMYTNGYILLTAFTTNQNAKVESTTNLLKATSWAVCTNAVLQTNLCTVTSLTWRITQQAQAEFYRVRKDIPVTKAGIYAELPMVALRGVTMDGETWTNWPDLSGIEANAGNIDTLQDWAVEVDKTTNAVWRLRQLLTGTNALPAATNLNSAIRMSNALSDAVDDATARLVGASPSPRSMAVRRPGDYADGEVAQYIMHKVSGRIVNGGTAGADGDLTMLSGTELVSDVPDVNYTNGVASGKSVYFENTLGLESPQSFDPLAGSSNFTVMAWVYRDGTINTSRIVSDTSAKTDGQGWEFMFSTSAGLLQLRVNGNSATADSGGIVPDSTDWHHVAVAYNGSKATFYVDGAQAGVQKSISGIVQSNNNALTIGNCSVNRTDYSQNGSAFEGLIDDVRIFRGWVPSSASDVAALMATNDATMMPPRNPSTPEELGEMDPDSLIYTADQVDAQVEMMTEDMSNALEASVAPVEARVDALETSAWSNLYVQWRALSDSEVNWIPTNKWPARSIVVCISIGSMTNLSLGIPGGWEPNEDCMVTFRVLRGSSSGTFHLRIGDSDITTISSGTARHVFAFRWLAGPKTWVLWRWNMTYANAVFDSSGNSKESTGIPIDDRFLPVIGASQDVNAQGLSASPQLLPGAGLSPAIIQPGEVLNDFNQSEGLEGLVFEEFDTKAVDEGNEEDI